VKNQPISIDLDGSIPRVWLRDCVSIRFDGRIFSAPEAKLYASHQTTRRPGTVNWLFSIFSFAASDQNGRSDDPRMLSGSLPITKVARGFSIGVLPHVMPSMFGATGSRECKEHK
jgi:hypothetical protein